MSSLDICLIQPSMDLSDVGSIVPESGGGIGPFGAKGIGEPAITAAAPARSPIRSL